MLAVILNRNQIIEPGAKTLCVMILAVNPGSHITETIMAGCCLEFVLHQKFRQE